MTALYSCIAFSPDEVELPEYRLVLDPGINAFTLLLSNADEFSYALANVGVQIKQLHLLDEPEDWDASLLQAATDGADSADGS